MGHYDKPIGVVTVGDTVYSPAGDKRMLPPKRWRRHRWGAVASFVLPDEQAEAAFEPGNRVLMDPTNLWSFGVGCIDCELTYQESHDKRCDAEEYVDPGGNT